MEIESLDFIGLEISRNYNKHKGEKILVIADGAAFGSEIDRVLQVIHGRKNVALFLPEC